MAAQVNTQYQEFRSNTNEELAKDLAKEKQIDFETAYQIIETGLEKGLFHLTGLSATRVLDFLKILSETITKAGYVGLLVLLDEPEVAAKQLGNEAVQGFIFELADNLQQRQGNYGIFLSMPQNFYAVCAQKFQSLPARLQSRQCFPRLSDIFGVTFASDLWHRYIEKFDLGSKGKAIIDPWALKAIGQIGSADCRHLSYGPRSVVSAFCSIVGNYLKKTTQYTTLDLLSDIQKQEIMIRPEYRTILTSILNSQDVTDENRHTVEFISVFPLGLKIEDLKKLEYEPLLRPLSAGNGLIQVTAQTMGLRALKFQTGGHQTDILEEMVQEFDSEFALGLKAHKNAIKSFVNFILPELFTKRKGATLIGWSDKESMKSLDSGIMYFGVKIGAFDEMSKSFPSRAAMIVAGSSDAEFGKIHIPNIDMSTGPVTYDLLYKFILHSSLLENNEKHNAVDLKVSRDNKGTKLIEFDINLDLVNCTLSHEYLGNMVGEDRISPIWLLGLLDQFSKQSFPMEFQNIWDVMQQDIIRDLKKCFFGIVFSDQLKSVVNSKYGLNLLEAGVGLLDKATTSILFEKYPNYSTLIRQPQWNQRIVDYIAALQNENIPLECKRGKKVWTATSQEITTALKTSLMNISGGAFDNFDNLIKIKSLGKDQPREVQFLIHPFEQEIYSFINSEINDARIKVDNIDCPYISFRVQLLDGLKEYGYTVEELRNIIDIGLARKTFEKKDSGGEEILFSRPLDIDGLKENLKFKLESFENEAKQMEKISWYRLNFDFKKAYQEIDKIQADTDYDGLNRFIDSKKYEHKTLVSTIPDRFIEEINRNLITPLFSSIKGLKEDRRIVSLRAIDAKSAWVNNLNEFIVPNFQQHLNSLKKEYDDIQRKSEQLKGQVADITHLKQQDMIDGLLETYNDYVIQGAFWDDVREEVKQFFIDLKYYEEWIKLKNESDQFYANILELKNNIAHKEKAEELLSKFNDISQEISEHLRLRNIDGLKDAQRFRNLLVTVDKERNDYLQSLRLEFINQKNKINDLFRLINLEPLKSIFDSLNIKSSYDSLYHDAIEKTRKDCISALRNELYNRQMDIQYASNILNTIDMETSDQLLNQLDEMMKKLSDQDQSLSSDWLKETIVVEKPEIVETITNAYKLSDELYRIIMNATKPKKLNDTKLIELNKEIEKKMDIDLKDLILFMSRRIKEPKEALDETLYHLIELFKSNNVEIIVKYRER